MRVCARCNALRNVSITHIALTHRTNTNPNGAFIITRADDELLHREEEDEGRERAPVPKHGDRRYGGDR